MPHVEPRSLLRFAEMVLASVQREYPNKISHGLASDADVAAPRQLTPAFFGCYDWHSAVHGHWTLARLCHLYPDADFVERARSALRRSLTADHLARELAYLSHPEHAGFEVPYGMAWLLTLHRELEEWADDEAVAWARRLSSLATLAAERIESMLERLPHPVRTGEHTQTAFGAGLYLDWASERRPREAERARHRLLALYRADRDAPLHFEPSGYDFLSPSLGEADLMRRLLPPPEFAEWLAGFLPGLSRPDTELLPPPCSPDPSDGKLSHLDGLASSRAWMLQGILSGLPGDDPRRAALGAMARVHADAGVARTTGDHYAGSHWQGTFVIYLLTGRGLPRGV